MIALLERHLREVRKSINDENTPIKYRKMSERELPKLLKDINRIYKEHSKLKLLEEKISGKYDLDYMKIWTSEED